MKTRWVLLSLSSQFQFPSSLIRPKLDPQTSTFLLDHVHISRLLPRCAQQGLSRLGSSVHASIIKNFEFHDYFDSDSTPDVLVVWNSLLCMYSQRNGVSSDAVKLFDEMPVRDIVSWNTVISGFLRNGQLDNAFGYFKRMRDLGFHQFDRATLTTVLSGLEGPEFLCLNKMVHCLVFHSGYGEEITVGNSLITSYFKCGCASSGRLVFDEMFQRNVITWTALISGLVHNEIYRESLNVLALMRSRGIVYPNALTYVSSLMACSGLQALTEGRQIHALLWKLGIESGLQVESALMDMYSKCGCIEETWQVFDSAKQLDNVAMTIVLSGYAENGFEDEAIQIFKKMVKTGIVIDSSLVSAALGAFSNANTLGIGKQIHSLILKKNFRHISYVNNRLINMYSKCGELKDSIRVFEEMPRRNSVSWNSMIASFARHGDGFGAVELYEKMKSEGEEPTDVTFLSLLHACSHVGLVEKGMEFLKSMVEDHGMRPRPEHYACVVDMLVRAGLLTEARDFIVRLPHKPGPLVWQALLGGCNFHSDFELGKFAAEQLVLTNPEHPASYIFLAKLYSSSGKWKERANTFDRMKETGVTKETGVSWIEIEKEVHSFVASDRMHLKAEVIYEVLDQLFRHTADEGYVPDKSFIHYTDDDQEEKIDHIENVLFA